MQEKIGFVGQGWIGKHYADDFEARGYATVRYALEKPFNLNCEALKDCTIVFVAVPTPTTIDGFDYSAVTSSLSLLNPGTIVVIKSTLLPGTTEELQTDFPDLIVLHSPEFLREASAAHDAANPNRNLIGIPANSPEHNKAAARVLEVLPSAPYTKVMSARSAELVKYAGNCFLYTKVVFMNLLYDVANAEGIDWNELREALVADPRIGDSHTKPVHTSGHVSDKSQIVRGAGGHCFIKDYEAFIELYGQRVGNNDGEAALMALRNYNNQLLKSSGKDLDLLKSIYGAQLPHEK